MVGPSLSSRIVFIDTTDSYIAHRSTLAAYLTVWYLINLYGRHSLLLSFIGPTFSLSPQFSFGLWMNAPRFVHCMLQSRRWWPLGTIWTCVARVEFDDKSLAWNIDDHLPPHFSTHRYRDLDHLSVLAFLCHGVASPCCESQTASSTADRPLAVVENILVIDVKVSRWSCSILLPWYPLDNRCLVFLLYVPITLHTYTSRDRWLHSSVVVTFPYDPMICFMLLMATFEITKFFLSSFFLSDFSFFYNWSAISWSWMALRLGTSKTQCEFSNLLWNITFLFRWRAAS